MQTEAQNAAGCPVWVSSRFSFAVPLDDGVIVYNSNTGAALQLTGEDASELAAMLTGQISEWRSTDLPEKLLETLCGGGFLVESGTNEVLLVRERYRLARGWTPLVVTLTTTMDCNLGCYYCYEARTADQLHAASIPAIQAWVTERLRRRTDKCLHVDWYGGEPTQNLSFLEEASRALQETCAEEGATYSASIISNGTTWPQDVGSFLTRNRIRQAQISFDGLKESHDRRRRYRRGRAPTPNASSFEIAAALVDELLQWVRVDIRINLDRRNQHELPQFVEFARRRGWFSRKFRAAIQPARLSAFSERSEFMRGYQLGAAEFEELRAQARGSVGPDVLVEESEVPDGYPFPRTSVCAALARDSFVVGADGLTYRCGLQVGETHRAVGRLKESVSADDFPDAAWWEAFDPTAQPSCSRCSFLPICWGGCPKKHLENDQQALREQSIYWRRNLPRLIAQRFSRSPVPGFTFSEQDQFR